MPSQQFCGAGADLFWLKRCSKGEAPAPTPAPPKENLTKLNLNELFFTELKYLNDLKVLY